MTDRPDDLRSQNVSREPEIRAALLALAHLSKLGHDNPPAPREPRDGRKRRLRIYPRDLAAMVHWSSRWRLTDDQADDPSFVPDLARRCAQKLYEMLPPFTLDGPMRPSIVAVLLRRLDLPISDDDLCRIVADVYGHRMRGLARWERRAARARELGIADLGAFARCPAAMVEDLARAGAAGAEDAPRAWPACLTFAEVAGVLDGRGGEDLRAAMSHLGYFPNDGEWWRTSNIEPEVLTARGAEILADLTTWLDASGGGA